MRQLRPDAGITLSLVLGHYADEQVRGAYSELVMEDKMDRARLMSPDQLWQLWKRIKAKHSRQLGR